MASQQMWVSTPAKGVWIPYPQATLQWSDEGQSVRTELLNGGAFVKRSQAHHRVSNPTWRGTLPQLQALRDLLNGIYGKPPFYYVDLSTKENTLPPHWAAPMLSAQGWPSQVTGVVPSLLPSVLGPGYPADAAHYVLPSTPVPTLAAGAPRCTVAIPPGYSAALTIWGTVTGSARVSVMAYDRASGIPTTTTLTPVITGVALTISGATYSHFVIFIDKATNGDTSTIKLGALMCTITTVGDPVFTWSGGRGVSGMMPDGPIASEIYHTRDPGWGTITCTLVEVGSWLHQP